MSETIQSVKDYHIRMLVSERSAVLRNTLTGKFVATGEKIDAEQVEETLGGEFLSSDDDYDANDPVDDNFGNPETNAILLEEGEAEWDDSDEDDDLDLEDDRYVAMAEAAEVEIAQRVAKKPVDSDTEDVEVEVECDWELSFDEDWEFPNLVDYDIEPEYFQDSFRDRPIVLPGKFGKHHNKSFSKPDTEERRHHKKLVSRMRRQRRVSDPARAWLDNAGLWLREEDEETAEYERELMIEMGTEMEDEREYDYREYLLDFASAEEYEQEMYLWWYEASVADDNQRHDSREDLGGNPIESIMAILPILFLADLAESDPESLMIAEQMATFSPELGHAFLDIKFHIWLDGLVAELHRKLAMRLLDQMIDRLTEIQSERAYHQELDDYYMREDFPGDDWDYDYDDGLDTGAGYDDFDIAYGHYGHEEDFEDDYYDHDDDFDDYFDDDDYNYDFQVNPWDYANFVEFEDVTDDDIGKVVPIAPPEHSRRGRARRWSKYHSPESRREQKVNDLMRREVRANHHRCLWLDEPEDEMAA